MRVIIKHHGKIDCKAIIQKIKLTKEEQEKADRIIKGEPVVRTKIYRGRGGSETEHTKSIVLSHMSVKKRLTELFGGVCSGCGKWPKYKILFPVEGATLVRRYCRACYDKWDKKK